VDHFLCLIEKLGGEFEFLPVVFGAPEDRTSGELASRLSERGIPFEDGTGKWSLGEVAVQLRKCAFLVAVDTGLLHLSEKVGTPVVAVFGPTQPDLGYGPRLPQSRSVATSLWCSPCGKDGRYCFRVMNRYACLKQIGADSVLAVIREASLFNP
jgi:ADP-heptose:LPS heptosyltransferase